MITYDDVKKNAKLLLTLTGFLPLEFEIFLIAFEKAWMDYIVKTHIDGKNRKRKYGGGRNTPLWKSVPPFFSNWSAKLRFV